LTTVRARLPQFAKNGNQNGNSAENNGHGNWNFRDKADDHGAREQQDEQ
jgi:hypothetical protein